MAVVARQTFEADAGDVRAARRFVTAETPEHRRDDVGLAVSELAANAVMHARTPFDVVVRRTRSVVHVDVTDGSPALPQVRRPPPGSVTGRGLSIVDMVVDRWGVTSTPLGKCVWFEVDVG